MFSGNHQVDRVEVLMTRQKQDGLAQPTCRGASQDLGCQGRPRLRCQCGALESIEVALCQIPIRTTHRQMMGNPRKVRREKRCPTGQVRDSSENRSCIALSLLGNSSEVALADQRGCEA